MDMRGLNSQHVVELTVARRREMSSDDQRFAIKVDLTKRAVGVLGLRPVHVEHVVPFRRHWIGLMHQARELTFCRIRLTAHRAIVRYAVDCLISAPSQHTLEWNHFRAPSANP